MTDRTARVHRKTAETEVSVSLNVDGRGHCEMRSGSAMLDHLLSQVARHGLFDIDVNAVGELDADRHHRVEDIAICLGRAFNEALGEKKGVVRMAHAVVPMDEALAMVAVDLSGRGYASIELDLGNERLGELSPDLLRHFLESLAIEGRFNLHVLLLAGSSNHHKAEACFKALGKALDGASQFEARAAGEAPSTKGFIAS